jgi:chemotaxis protein MotB
MAEDETQTDELSEEDSVLEEVDASGVEAAAERAVDASDIGPSVAAADDEEDGCPECKQGAPGWMATFADMATLLMAFFVLILSFSDTELPRFEYINGNIQYAFGVKKIVPKITIPAGRNILKENFTPNPAERTVINDPTQREIDSTSENLLRRTEKSPERFVEELEATKIALADQVATGMVTVSADGQQIVVKVKNIEAAGQEFGVDASSDGSASQILIDTASIVADVQASISTEIGVFLSTTEEEESDLPEDEFLYSGQIAEQIESNRLESLRADLQTEISNGLLEVEKEGDDIVVRIASQGSFNSGSAEFARSFTGTLDQVGQAIGSDVGGVRIEGHTDNIPVAFSETFNSNWDLSAARAASVASYLTDRSGLASERVEVIGFADTVPLASNDSADGRSRNRRIEIRIPD